MSALELLAAEHIYNVSGSDETIIGTKGSFLFRTGTTAMSTRNKERRGFLFVGSTRSNGTVTSQCLRVTAGTVIPVFRQQKSKTFCREFHKRNTLSASWRYRKKMISRSPPPQVAFWAAWPTYFPANPFLFFLYDTFLKQLDGNVDKIKI
jgi:hypothetical protein